MLLLSRCYIRRIDRRHSDGSLRRRFEELQGGNIRQVAHFQRLDVQIRAAQRVDIAGLVCHEDLRQTQRTRLHTARGTRLEMHSRGAPTQRVEHGTLHLAGNHTNDTKQQGRDERVRTAQQTKAMQKEHATDTVRTCLNPDS